MSSTLESTPEEYRAEIKAYIEKALPMLREVWGLCSLNVAELPEQVDTGLITTAYNNLDFFISSSPVFLKQKERRSQSLNGFYFRTPEFLNRRLYGGDSGVSWQELKHIFGAVPLATPNPIEGSRGKPTGRPQSNLGTRPRRVQNENIM